MAKTKLLIVEDDNAIRTLYTLKLTKSGFEVLEAADGGKGLEMAKKELPDIILLDVMMPVMNGFEVLKELRKSKDTAEIPVIILSNFGEVDQMTQGFVVGATDYLIKAEHTPSDVVDIVNETLKNKGNIAGVAFKD
jgi:two-component system, OmpR family, alkaline phosphatase synthesis response regulator PhoP